MQSIQTAMTMKYVGHQKEPSTRAGHDFHSKNWALPDFLIAAVLPF